MTWTTARWWIGERANDELETSRATAVSTFVISAPATSNPFCGDSWRARRVFRRHSFLDKQDPLQYTILAVQLNVRWHHHAPSSSRAGRTPQNQKSRACSAIHEVVCATLGGHRAGSCGYHWWDFRVVFWCDTVHGFLRSIVYLRLLRRTVSALRSGLVGWRWSGCVVGSVVCGP
jgi:hypothetical protein